MKRCVTCKMLSPVKTIICKDFSLQGVVICKGLLSVRCYYLQEIIVCRTAVFYRLSMVRIELLKEQTVSGEGI